MKQTHITACTRDCPDACSLKVEVQKGRILKIKGNPDHPYTRGLSCAKIQRFPYRLSSPNRLRRPLLKRGGTWQETSWDEALSLCADKMDTARRRPSSILHLRGGAAKGVSKFAESLFFARLGASGVEPHGVCDTTGIAACMEDFGALEMNDPSELLKGKGIVVWGKKLGVSSVHMGALVADARNRGAEVVSISPRSNENRRFSDRIIRIKPGTDRFLALAVAREIMARYGFSSRIDGQSSSPDQFRTLLARYAPFELSRSAEVTDREVTELAEFYHDYHPCATLVGYGLQRYLHGAENVRAINALSFITGNIGIPGGGCYYSVPSGQNLNLHWVPSAHYARTFPVAHIGRSIWGASNPPIRLVWISMWNPVNQTPESLVLADALKKTDFVVAVDSFLTDTAEVADLVLPCAMMFEEEDVVGSWGHHFVHYAKAITAPPDGVRSDLEILTELGRRIHPPIQLEDREVYLRKSVDSPFLDTTLEELRTKGFVRARRPAVAFEAGRFSHADGRFRFLVEVSPEPSAEDAYPLTLLTLIRKDFLHSQILPEEHPSLSPQAFVSPATLRAAGLKDGGEGRIVSPLAAIQVRLRAEEGLHPSAVAIGRGPWLKFGWGTNRLIHGIFTDRPDGVAFYGQRVRVERL